MVMEIVLRDSLSNRIPEKKSQSGHKTRQSNAWLDELRGEVRERRWQHGNSSVSEREEGVRVLLAPNRSTFGPEGERDFKGLTPRESTVGTTAINGHSTDNRRETAHSTLYKAVLVEYTLSAGFPHFGPITLHGFSGAYPVIHDY